MLSKENERNLHWSPHAHIFSPYSRETKAVAVYEVLHILRVSPCGWWQDPSDVIRLERRKLLSEPVGQSVAPFSVYFFV